MTRRYAEDLKDWRVREEETRPQAPGINHIEQAALDLKLDDTQAGAFGLALLAAANLAAAKASLAYTIADISGLTAALNAKLDDSQADSFGLQMLATSSLTAGKALLALAKVDVGLGNADNTSDVNKPVSTLQAAALALKQDLHADLTAVAGSGLAGAWTVMSPAPTVTASGGTFTSANATCRYLKIGKTCWFRARVNIVTNGTAAIAIRCTMPFAAATTTAGDYQPFAADDITTGYALRAILNNGSSNALITKYDGTYPGVDGYQLVFAGAYETA
jgi:hypothetical protein